MYGYYLPQTTISLKSHINSQFSTGQVFSKISNNNKLMKQSHLKDIKEIIDKRRWSYLGHIPRRPSLPMSTKHENASYGEKKKGRPRKNIATIIKNDLNKKTLELGRSEKPRPEQRRLEKQNLFQNIC